MTADPRVSLGARLERKAVLAHYRRILKRGVIVLTANEIAWLLKRQQRYDKKPGGLGK